MLVRKYVGKQILSTFLSILLIIVLIALSNKFVSFISKAANGEMATSTLFKLILLHIPELLAVLLPLCFYLSVVLVIGKLYVEQEMVAMQANGVSWNELLKTCSLLALPVMLVVGTLTIWSLPEFHRYKEELLGQEEPSILIQTLSPGRFHSLLNGRLVFYVEDAQRESGKLSEVFIAEQPQHHEDTNGTWGVLTAQAGQFITEPASNNRYLELYHGQRYEGVPGHRDYLVVDYERYGLLIDRKPEEVPMFNRVTPTSFLWSSPTNTHQAELQWRLSLPLTVPILMMLALGIAYIPPRAGRYRRVIPAILGYIFYYNLMTVAKRAVEKGDLPPSLGLWWVHAVMLGIALYTWFRHTGQWQLWCYRLKEGKNTP